MNTKLLSLGTLSVAGVVAAGALAFPTASAWADEDAVKRDEDTPSVTTVDDGDPDGNDPTNTNGPTNGPTNTTPTNGPTNLTQGVTNDVTQHDLTQNDATQDDATGTSSAG